ncbi:MAG: sugar phosphate isomerase/epimerase [Chloroflexota bacterium]|nr:sugar phosphate isomerase/epimerase [Chloroflexia bacterium]MDQ3226339.1 sugar phosphate isomerase/epimerase [Chloroflexota bacterium]
MRLAVSGQLLAQTHALSEIVDILQDLDVDAIELWPHNIPGGTGPEETQRYERKEIAATRQLLDERGMAVACLTLGFSILGKCTEAGAGYGTAALKGAVDAAAALGAPIVNCYLAGLAPELFVAAARPAADYAGSAGVTIVLENEAHDASGPAAGVRAIIEAVGSPHFGTQYDPCNYYHANEEPYPGAYEIVKDAIRYVHLKGGCHYDPVARPHDKKGGTLRGSEDRYIGYTSIPDGVVNADGVLRRLAQDGYTGYVTLEPHVAAEQALAYYRIDVPYVQERLRALQAVAV